MIRPLAVLLLAAGCGTRLRPYTNQWPKCLMPIKEKPLLEHWLAIVKRAGATNVIVNLHYLAEIVQEFLSRSIFKDWVYGIYEPELTGTAGALRANYENLQNSTILLVHADNYCDCNFDEFIRFHYTERPKDCPITMMVFNSQTPETCGIVETDEHNLVQKFHEKVKDPPGNLANGAVYLLEPEVLEWIYHHKEITDFSSEVIPQFIGRIVTWRNEGIHIDIGSIQALREAQISTSKDAASLNNIHDDWTKRFASHPIHQQIKLGVQS